jgi:hypothetical protein
MGYLDLEHEKDRQSLQLKCVFKCHVFQDGLNKYLFSILSFPGDEKYPIRWAMISLSLLIKKQKKKQICLNKTISMAFIEITVLLYWHAGCGLKFQTG